MDVSDGFTEFVESFDGGLTTGSKFVEKLIGELSESVFVYPEYELSVGGVVTARFLDVS